MYKRIFCAAALPFLMGCVVGVSFGMLPIVLSVLVAVYLLVPFGKEVLHEGKKEELVLRCVLVLLCFAGGLLRYRVSKSTAEAEMKGFAKGDEVTVTCRITDKKHGGGALYGEDFVLYVSDAENIAIGSLIQADGIYFPFERATNEGQLDSRAVQLSRGFSHAVYIADKADITVLQEPKVALSEALFRLTDRMEQTFEESLPEMQSSLVKAMAVGDKSDLDTEVSALFQRSGVSHVLVVSGLHISLIGLGLYKILKKRLPITAAALMAGCVVLLYGQMTGFGVSAARAVLMFLVVLFARILGRTYDGLSALSLAMLLLLIDNPFRILSSAFVLSFYQTGMILVLSDLLKKYEEKEEMRVKAAFSLLIPIMGYPVIACCFYEISIVSLALNFLLLPAMGVIMYLSVLGGLLGSLWLPLGRVLLFPVRIVLALDVWLCTLFDKVPYGYMICGKPSVFRLCIYFGLLSMLFLSLRKKLCVRRIVLLLPVFLCILLLPKPHRFEVDVLDVGQGDGIFFSTAEGETLFLDGGSTDVKALGRFRLLPFLKYKGVRRIDYWILSHLDNDHISGFYECVEADYPISHLVLAENIYQDEAYDKLMEVTAEAGIDVVYLSEGDILSLTETEMVCVGPGTKVTANDRNARSLAFLYESDGFVGFFGGDSTADEEPLMVDSGLLKTVDIYKASHHGSAYSTSDDLLAALNPAICVISAGKENRYGHPAEEMLSRLEQRRIPYLCTIESGEVTFFKQKGRLCFKTYCGNRD